jgi:hypothetical protein
MTDQQITRDAVIGPFPLPPVTDELRAEARAKEPGAWIAFVDPATEPASGQPPRFAVQGGYQVGEGGQLADYWVNPEYHPSERRAGFRFRSGFEVTLWRVLHGYNPLGVLADSFYHSTFLPCAQNEDESELVLCTSSAFCHREHAEDVTGASVLDQAGDSEAVLSINPGADLSMRLPARDVAGLITDETPHILDEYGHPSRGQ